MVSIPDADWRWQMLLFNGKTSPNSVQKKKPQYFGSFYFLKILNLEHFPRSLIPDAPSVIDRNTPRHYFKCVRKSGFREASKKLSEAETVRLFLSPQDAPAAFSLHTYHYYFFLVSFYGIDWREGCSFKGENTIRVVTLFIFYKDFNVIIKPALFALSNCSCGSTTLLSLGYLATLPTP